MLFQGQEFASSAPFLYFADHEPALAATVAKGRREFLLQFPSLKRFPLPAPDEEAVFRQCRIDWSERKAHECVLRLHRDLIALKRGDPVFRRQGRDGIDGSVLSDTAFFARFFARDGRDRLLIVNLESDLTPRIFPDPLLAPPEGRRWRPLWSSDDPAYGGDGIRNAVDEAGHWLFPGQATTVMAAE
jgi:maltooligosyltrehalose trehalohydrolase